VAPADAGSDGEVKDWNGAAEAARLQKQRSGDRLYCRTVSNLGRGGYQSFFADVFF